MPRSVSPAPPARQSSLAVDTPARLSSLAVDTPARQSSLVAVDAGRAMALTSRQAARGAQPPPYLPATPVRQSSLDVADAEADALAIAVESSPEGVVAQLDLAPSPEWSPPTRPTVPVDAPFEHLDLGMLGIAPTQSRQFVVPPRSSSALFA